MSWVLVAQLKGSVIESGGFIATVLSSDLHRRYFVSYV